MSKDLMNYDQVVEDALKGVVRSTLTRVAETGLPGNHHFYISFRTDDPRTEISDNLKSQYPEEMTIVLQHQYWGLTVEDESFEVTLSFNKVQERLHVPFDGLTGFFDPSVQFGLQFQGSDGRAGKLPMTTTSAPQGLPARPEDLAPPKPKTEEPVADEKVVTLDQFRKK